MAEKLDKRLTEKFDKLAAIQGEIVSELISRELLSKISDKWFLENLIFSVNPAELYKVLNKADENFEARDNIICDVIRAWLLVGDNKTQLREVASIIISKNMPYASSKKDRSGQAVKFGLTLKELVKVSPEIARLSYLAGRIHCPGIRTRYQAHKGVRKRGKEISYVVMLLRALHCFIDQKGDQCPETIAKDALMRAVYGSEAIESGMASKIEKSKIASDASRASRDTLFRAWDRYSEQAAILYALSSLIEENGQSFLTNLIESNDYGDNLVSSFPEIMSRARYVNDHILRRLSSSEDWHTSVEVESPNMEKRLSTKTNAHTIKLIREVGATPEPFDPEPVAQDIIDWLSEHYKI